MALVDMALSAEEARKESDCCGMTSSSAADDNAPKYPWGLTLNLDDAALEKLGITSLPEVGKSMTLTARVEVCSTSQYDNQKGSDKSVSLQVTAMELGAASESSEVDLASVLYGSKS